MSVTLLGILVGDLGHLLVVGLLVGLLVLLVDGLVGNLVGLLVGLLVGGLVDHLLVDYPTLDNPTDRSHPLSTIALQYVFHGNREMGDEMRYR